MTPIEKNIIVVDENGKQYESTYLKRAKGLVKNGRAHFAEENKICLMRPPENYLEDKDMLILADKLRKLSPEMLRIVENIIDECAKI